MVGNIFDDWWFASYKILNCPSGLSKKIDIHEKWWKVFFSLLSRRTEMTNFTCVIEITIINKRIQSRQHSPCISRNVSKLKMLQSTNRNRGFHCWEKKIIWLKNLVFSVEGDSVRKYEWSTSSTKVIIFEVITSCRREMLYKKTSEQCSQFENKNHIQRKIL